MDTVCMILLDIERYRGHKLTSHLHSLVNIIALITLTAWLWSSFSWLWLIMTIQTVVCHFHDDANHIALNENHHNCCDDNVTLFTQVLEFVDCHGNEVHSICRTCYQSCSTKGSVRVQRLSSAHWGFHEKFVEKGEPLLPLEEGFHDKGFQKLDPSTSACLHKARRKRWLHPPISSITNI